MCQSGSALCVSGKTRNEYGKDMHEYGKCFTGCSPSMPDRAQRPGRRNDQAHAFSDPCCIHRAHARFVPSAAGFQDHDTPLPPENSS